MEDSTLSDLILAAGCLFGAAGVVVTATTLWGLILVGIGLGLAVVSGDM